MVIAFSGVENVVIAQDSTDLDDLIESGLPERIATGFGFTEGPVWHPDGYLLFSDVPGNTIYKWTLDGKLEKFRSPSGFSNGPVSQVPSCSKLLTMISADPIIR